MSPAQSLLPPGWAGCRRATPHKPCGTSSQARRVQRAWWASTFHSPAERHAASGPAGPPVPRATEGCGGGGGRRPARTDANLPSIYLHPSSDQSLRESYPTHPRQSDRARSPSIPPGVSTRACGVWISCSFCENTQKCSAPLFQTRYPPQQGPRYTVLEHPIPVWVTVTSGCLLIRGTAPPQVPRVNQRGSPLWGSDPREQQRNSWETLPLGLTLPASPKILKKLRV